MLRSLFVLLVASAAAEIEQVHLALGNTTDTLNVQWATSAEGATSEIMWGLSEGSLTQRNTGDTRNFTVDPGRVWYTHTASMTGLKTNTVYYYKVGDEKNGYSKVFKVMNRREGAPYLHVLMGDMGSSCAFSLCSECTQKSEVCDENTCKGHTDKGLVAELDADMILHVGDFAYDLASGKGSTGDQFFKNIEQVAGYVPYMVSHGNHEDSAENLAHYIESFRNMPSNAVPSTFTTKNGETTNTMYFSWDHGLVHYVAMSTELWFGVTDGKTTKDSFISWLKDDLKKANANRDAVPWVVVHGHRSIYCSCDGDCDGPAMKIRQDLEPIFFEYGVDFFINGHEHNYERMWPTYQNKSDQSNIDPKATVYIVTGAAGSHEMHEPFTRPQPSWSAFRSNSFSYTRMYVYNSTHIHWQQIQTDPTLFPKSDYGRVIDDTWFVQHQHGPFDPAKAPKVKPTSCPMCGQEDHWAPLLGLDDGTGRSTDVLIREFRAKHGEEAWREKLRGLMRIVNSRKVVWEDVREDGNSDGAALGDFKWKGGNA
eukprot:Sspe_Gene.31210::Locus_15406_Transcript_1_3_Confidence_0.250_Length_1816::g.31210::m.31210